MIDTDGRLHLLKDSEALALGSETIPALNRKTGLIDVPTTTLDGAAQVESLLNPNLYPGKRIKINNRDVTSYTNVDTSNLAATPQAVADRVQLSRRRPLHHRAGAPPRTEPGNPWYSSIVTLRAHVSPSWRPAFCNGTTA